MSQWSLPRTPFTYDRARSAKVPLSPCRHCGHPNRPVRSARASLKLWLTDQLPPCRRCGFALKKSDFKPDVPPEYSEVVPCPECGAMNRILRGYRAQLKCGHCKSSLLPPHLRSSM